MTSTRPLILRKTRFRVFSIPGKSIKTAREYARIKIDGLRLVGGNPDFTSAPGHGDDARFYDRQQAYVHAGGG